MDAGATFGTAGMVGTAVVCGFRVTGIVGATGEGCASCAGLMGAVCDAEMQGLAVCIQILQRVSYMATG